MRDIIVLLVMMVGVLSSCDDSVAYHHFENISDEGWDVRDSMVFLVDTIKQEGTYTSLVCVRATKDYPYRNLSLTVSQTVMPAGKEKVMTFPVELKQDDGIATGQGMAYYTYEIPYSENNLHPGDSIRIVVRHHMRRETLPGITDVGVKVQLTVNN